MSRPSPTRPVQVDPDLANPAVPVDEAARLALAELQLALSEVVAALPGAEEASRAVDLQRLLGLDKKLGWSLHKFVTAPDPLTELVHVPGGPSIRRILAAAARRRVPRSATEQAAAAFNRFESFVAEHGGDRSELISLTNGLSNAGSSDQQHDLRIRKSVFKGMTHLWGIKAETSIRTMAFGPGAPGTQDLVGIRGDLGLQRLRHGVPLTVAMYIQNHPKASGTLPTAVRPEQALRGLEVLEHFSSSPLPNMEARPQPDGSVETDVVFPPSGRSGAVTLYAAQHVAATARGEQSLYQQGAAVRIPCERMVCEILVPQGWSDPATARVAVYGRRDGVERVFDRRTMDLLPQREVPTYLGVHKTAPALAGAPNHPEAVREALHRIGWQGTRYDAYRCIVEYPVLHTMISLDVDAARR